MSRCESVGQNDSHALLGADIDFLNMGVEVSAPFMAKPWRQAVLMAEAALHFHHVPMGWLLQVSLPGSWPEMRAGSLLQGKLSVWEMRPGSVDPDASNTT